MSRARFWILCSLLLGCTPDQVGCEPRSETTEAVVELPHPEQDAPVVPRSDGEHVEHTLRFDGAANHYFSVETIFPVGEGEQDYTVQLAVWAPGSYLIREYSRHFENVRFTTLEGEPLAFEKVSKNRWKVSSEAALPERIVARYDVYANELSVRTNFVDADFAALNGAPTFMVPSGELNLGHDVRFELPEHWASSHTALAPLPGEAHQYSARNYDELVDSPVLLGNPDVSTMEINGIEHSLVSMDAHGIFDQRRAAEDVRRIVETQHAFWGGAPYDRYMFLSLLTGGGGGLEHKASTMIIGDRWLTRDEDAYRRWLGLVSHEFFHTWNVKRLRPLALGPFDYENENYVRDLWVVEGITSYYDDLMVRRSGLMTRGDYLGVLSRAIEGLQNRAGRRHQSLSEASFDAWVKYYRQDENSGNSQISYYRKGSIVAWLLDAQIRAATGDEKSLDDVMRLAYERFPEQRHGYTPQQFRDVASEVADVDLDPFFAAVVDGRGELGYSVALRHFGLRFAEAPADDDAPAWLGLRTETRHGRLMVRSVHRDGPAWEAGINPGDELLAIGEERLPEDLDERLGQLRPGEVGSVLISRRGHLRRLEVTFGQAPASAWTIEQDPEASPQQRRRYEGWVGDESSPLSSDAGVTEDAGEAEGDAGVPEGGDAGELVGEDGVAAGEPAESGETESGEAESPAAENGEAPEVAPPSTDSPAPAPTEAAVEQAPAIEAPAGN